MPFQFDTPFRRRARALKAPNREDFDLAEWSAALAEVEPTQDDCRLMITALWLAHQAKTLREYFAAKPLPKLSANLSVTLAVAMLNRENAVMDKKAGKARLAVLKAGGMATDFIIHVSVKRADGMFETDTSSFTDAAVDAADSWIYDVTESHEPAAQKEDLGNTAVRYVQHYSLKRSHYDIWQRVLWESWALHSVKDGSNTRTMLLPADADLALRLDAFGHRNESNAMGYAWIDMSMWPTMSMPARRAKNLPFTVIAVELQNGRPRHFNIRRPKSNTPFPPPYMMGRSQLEVGYLANFLDRPFPKDGDLSLALLVRAWYVMRDLAGALARKRSKATFNDVANVRSWALVVKWTELVDVLARALEIPQARAERVVGFLSWRKGAYKGLWGAPLVPLPGTDEYGLVEPVLQVTNKVRTAEIWLANGGLDDNAPKAARGDVFECDLRQKIRESLTRNAIVTDSACAPHAIKKDKNFPEEIDLLVQFATLLLVCEVKCFSYPADSRERYNHLRKLRDAAGQANRKVAAIAKRPDVVAKVLGIDEDKVQTLTVTPLVVTNHGFGISMEFDGCVVTDVRFLDVYLGSGSYVSESSVDSIKGGMAQQKRHLYRTPQEAVARFAATMRNPPPLERFVDRLEWTSMGFPTYDGTALLIAQTRLADVSGALRQTYKNLTAVLNEPDDQ